MEYIMNYGDKESRRYNMIKNLFQPQLRSGMKQFIFLPSDPDQLVKSTQVNCVRKSRK